MFGKDAIVISLKLFIITAVAALCLAFVNKVTEPVIEKNAQLSKVKALNNILDAEEFSDPETVGKDIDGITIEEIYVGKNGDDVAGYVVNAVSHEGYGGDIKVMVGFDKTFEVTKIEILEASETAGLGANASKPSFAGQFEGTKGVLEVVKGDAKDGQISAISSATVTSKAVTNAVNASRKIVEEKFGGAE